MGSREFAEWMAYDRLDPLGDERADLNAGIIASMIANANRDPAKHPKPFRVQECMAFYGEAARAPRPDSAGLLARLKAALRRARKEA